MAQEFQSTLTVGEQNYTYYPVSQVAGADALPMSLKVLAENRLRNAASAEEGRAAVGRIVEAACAHASGEEIDFAPARVLFQDFTGVPAFVDYASMREACIDLSCAPERINPQVPCNLVIDHSVIADEAGHPDALAANMALEATRNAERYTFLKWAQTSFDNVEITSPGQGICHQLNIERFAKVVMCAPAAQGAEGEGEDEAAEGVAREVYFDTLVGTESHTPTAAGLGILGRGVGGIEAEAASLGQPITILVPRVIGVHLTGTMTPGVTGMDVALRFAYELRKLGVVGAFVECFGPGTSQLTATQRTCISNMSPEYGCTATLFPIDERTLDYLALTGRAPEQIALVEAYARAQGVWGAHDDASRYAQVLELDLTSVVPAVAGPSRPHEFIAASTAQIRFRTLCAERDLNLYRTQNVDGHELRHGAIAIAALTSCTTAADPAMMVAAGLLARNAAAVGLSAKPWVKTIFDPGSHAIVTAFESAGFTEGLAQCGFYTCGYGCMSCIGNSGPLSAAMHEVADKLELCAVLSGNRNFEGRISPDVSQNYLMAPGMVVAYALAGTVDFNFAITPLTTRDDGTPVYLRDIAPTQAEIDEVVAATVTPDLFAAGEGAGEGEGAEGACGEISAWDALPSVKSSVFDWDAASTYVRKAPFFDALSPEPVPPAPVTGARVLAVFGDFITTDHISPAGAIAPESPAATYLLSWGVDEKDFNT